MYASVPGTDAQHPKVTGSHRREWARTFLVPQSLKPPTSEFIYPIYVVFYPPKLCTGASSLKTAHNVTTSSGSSDPQYSPLWAKTFSGPQTGSTMGVFGGQILNNRDVVSGHNISMDNLTE